MSANSDPSQANLKAKEAGPLNNLCYCVPEFSNLDIAHLPDTDDLLKELAAKLDYSGFSRAEINGRQLAQ